MSLVYLEVFVEKREVGGEFEDRGIRHRMLEVRVLIRVPWQERCMLG